MKGKKAVSEGIVNFFLFIGFLLLFLVFSTLYRQSSVGVTMASDIGYAEAQTSLNVFLRSPVTVYGEKMTLAELIGRASLNETYRRIVRSEIRKVIAPSPSDPVFGGMMRFEMMVESPAGEGIERSAWPDANGRWEWHEKTHGGSYYVGKYDPIMSDANSPSNGRLKVGEALIPGRDGTFINVTLWKSFSPERNKKDAQNPGAFTYTDLASSSLYPGEMIEDNGGNLVVFWDIGDRVMVSIDGAPCPSRYTFTGEDSVTCLDGSLPQKGDLLSLEDYITGTPFTLLPEKDPGETDPSAAGQVTYKELIDLQVGATITLGKDAWMKWGEDPSSYSGTIYFAKDSETDALCDHILLETYRSNIDYTCPPTSQDPGYGESLIMLERMDAKTTGRESVFATGVELKSRYGLS